MLAVYGAHLFGIGLGLWIKSSVSSPAKKWLKVLCSGIAAALIFYIMTNFAFLYTFYPHTMAGVLASYANAIPFIRGTLMGDIGYSLLCTDVQSYK